MTFTLSPFDFTMSPDLPGFLFDILRNPVAAVGIPLTLGFLSGSATKNVIRGIWYRVRASALNAAPSPHNRSHVEPYVPSWKTPATCIPNHLDSIVRSDGLRFLPGRHAPRQCRSVYHKVWDHGLPPLYALTESGRASI